VAQKTYLIGLRLVLNGAKRYIQHNQLNLQKNASAPLYTCILDTLTAILSCLELIPDEPVT